MRLNQVTVSARDMGASIAFYEALGLELIVRSEHYARFACRDAEGGGPPATFSLHRDAEAKGVAETVVYFEEDDLDATVARLAAAGLVFDQPPTDREWLWREAYLRDPSGNVVCLYRAGAIRLDPPWRLEK
jgi:catechol 2,3-dioxygenase-like lactoylglutathione lyase family enzyme